MRPKSTLLILLIAMGSLLVDGWGVSQAVVTDTHLESSAAGGDPAMNVPTTLSTTKATPPKAAYFSHLASSMFPPIDENVA